MTKHSPRIQGKVSNGIGRFVVFCFFVAISACGYATDKKSEELGVKDSNMTLWQLIDDLAGSIPFSKQKLERVLSTVLTEESRNDYTIFYKGAEVRLKDGVLKSIDLRIGSDNAARGFLVLELRGECINHATVREHYSGMKITQFPTGRSSQEMTAYTVVTNWGKLSFGFREENPDCLAAVTFEPK